jgi:hypothetical protein
MSTTTAAENLDAIVERVTESFTQEIMELNNNECEYVLDQLVTKFEGLLERVREGDVR